MRMAKSEINYARIFYYLKMFFLEVCKRLNQNSGELNHLIPTSLVYLRPKIQRTNHLLALAVQNHSQPSPTGNVIWNECTKSV